MASSMIFTPTSSIVCLPSLSSSSHSKKQAATVSFPDFSNFEIAVQLRFTQYNGLRTQYNGLRKIHSISTSPNLLKIEMKRKRRNKGGVYASLFGVGAPEALVIGVVALLVFGPKGLAEVARNLGKTLRAFQPTIRELQDVSREFKSTLEREIGLDDIQSTPGDRYTSSTTTTTSKPSVDTSTGDDSQMKIDPNGSPSAGKAYSSEDYLKITEEQLRAASAVGVQKHGDETPPTEQQRSVIESSTNQEGSNPASTGEKSPAEDARGEVRASTPTPSGQPEIET